MTSLSPTIQLFLKQYRLAFDKSIPLEDFKDYYLSLSSEDKQTILQFYNQQKSNQLLSNLDHHLLMFKFLIEQNFDYNKLTLNQQSLLIFMIKNEKWNFVDYLLKQPNINIHYAKKNPEGNPIGDNALCFAVDKGHFSTVQKLYNLGADPLYLNENKIPILLFSLKSNPDISYNNSYIDCFFFLAQKEEVQKQIQNNKSFQHLLFFYAVKNTKPSFLEVVFEFFLPDENIFKKVHEILTKESKSIIGYEENLIIFEKVYQKSYLEKQLKYKNTTNQIVKI